ncbi:hypothetical protein Tco_0989369 [Tanacetum coccineum]|uniref:Uncharacterized protein n=1 Tax=Tanacetum coccineum TaxID=301880 RepID=A0ABQ5EUK2_9ASTR
MPSLKVQLSMSLIEQFWQTASANTLENRDMEITATIDGKVKVVSKASIRRHLKLKDSDGISTFPTSEIFEQLALIRVDTPLFQTMLVQGQILQGDGSTILVDSHHTPINAPSTSQPPTSPPSMQTTHVVEGATTMPQSGDFGIRLKGRKIAQIDEDEGITLVQMNAQTQGRHEHDFEESDFEFIAPEEDYTAEPNISTTNVPVSTAGAEFSTASPKVKTAAESLVYIRRSAAKRKDKGKAIMKEAEPVQKKTKLQLEQERLRLEEALRLQEQLDEEERQRIARVHERFNSIEPTENKERELWVELKRLFKPDDDDTLWKLQRYMHDPLKWRFYDTCVVHHVSTERGHDIFMLVEKDYPLTRAVMTLMLSNKLQVDEYSVMADELLRKIFILANRPRQ